MIISIELVVAGMEAYNWGSEVSATCWVLFIHYEQGNSDAEADEELLFWTAITGLLQILTSFIDYEQSNRDVGADEEKCWWAGVLMRRSADEQLQKEKKNKKPR